MSTTGEKVNECEEQPKLPRPEMYRGQIWSNADGSSARKVVSIRHPSTGPWRLSWQQSTEDGWEEEAARGTIDEFLFWAMRVHAMPMMDRYQD